MTRTERWQRSGVTLDVMIMAPDSADWHNLLQARMQQAPNLSHRHPAARYS